MIPRILLSVLLGVGIGAPVARAGGSVDSPYDPMRTNVFYDLAVLYGDANGDGHVDTMTGQDLLDYGATVVLVDGALKN